jgi:hypothetical protein
MLGNCVDKDCNFSSCTCCCCRALCFSCCSLLDVAGVLRVGDTVFVLSLLLRATTLLLCCFNRPKDSCADCCCMPSVCTCAW